MSIAVVVLVALFVYVGCASAMLVVVFFRRRKGGGGMIFSACLPFGAFGIPPCLVALSPLSCGAVLLERGCVLLGVRFSSVMCFHGVGFEA